MLHGFPSHHTEATPTWGLLVIAFRSGTPAAKSIACMPELPVSIGLLGRANWTETNLSTGEIMTPGNGRRVSVQSRSAVFVFCVGG